MSRSGSAWSAVESAESIGGTAQARRCAMMPEFSRPELEALEGKAVEAEQPEPGQGGCILALLALLGGSGLLNPDRLDDNRRAVESFPMLEAYLDAARALVSYYRSRERAEYVQPLDNPPIVGGPVSI